ncbi:hypothetical protein QTP70_003938, partial [Hemibagrus guttatus]|jgi:hypothetical protein
MDF